jgi:hypothetical protein
MFGDSPAPTIELTWALNDDLAGRTLGLLGWAISAPRWRGSDKPSA